jgi:hypothetical protein
MTLTVSLYDPETGLGFGSETQVNEVDVLLSVEEFTDRIVKPAVAIVLARTLGKPYGAEA